MDINRIHCENGDKCMNGLHETSAGRISKQPHRMGSLREVKVCLLGDSGVGKSSIVQRFVTDTYHDNISPTIGASFMGKTLQVGNESFKFQIWDTAGQEKYRGLAPMYYRNAGAAIIVYDITNQSTFDLIKVWVRELHQHGPENICIAIAGNKCDLEDLREVTERDGAAYASEINAVFGETSAKTAKNISEIFIEISKNLPPLEFEKYKQGVIQVDSPKKNKRKGCCK
ncbi:Ras-related protein Rab-22A [Holothuria leucospilota]|uniref:Ras-related protein Rab-22A n=1 Tax=Holothuria leucospilota TaxID=206669 RepID=A0A9Q1HDG3_HOLLE|nr:Ras-related protein Rab-22A [Holothuria leucospilota]